MTTNSTTPSRANTSGFRSSAPAERATDPPRAPQQQTTQTTIRDVPAGPERKTWYECPQCGRPANLDGEKPPHCPLCGARAVARTWTRPDHEAPAPRPAHYEEIRNANPWRALPDGEYRIMRKTRAPE